MEERKYVCNEAGRCPVCGSSNLEWGNSDCTGDYINYEWTCKDCGAEGCEWYKLVFDGHEVATPFAIDEKGNPIDYENESVNDYILPNE